MVGCNVENGDTVAIKRIEKKSLADEQECLDLQLEVDVMNRIGVGSLNCIWLHEVFHKLPAPAWVMQHSTDVASVEMCCKAAVTST